ncbi:MAG: hypothetical protein ACJ795_18275 [Ktedonobacteraceae bacterium]
MDFWTQLSPPTVVVGGSGSTLGFFIVFLTPSILALTTVLALAALPELGSTMMVT